MSMIGCGEKLYHVGYILQNSLLGVFFVCLFWKVGCVSTGVVTVFVFFPSVLPVIRTMLILFLQLARGSLKRINQYPLLIPHTAASYLKPCPCYFFLLYPFFQELTQNYDAPTSQMFSLLLFRSFFTSEFFLFLFFNPPPLSWADCLSDETWMKTELCIFSCTLTSSHPFVSSNSAHQSAKSMCFYIRMTVASSFVLTLLLLLA